jgi:hypothetical protein
MQVVRYPTAPTVLVTPLCCHRVYVNLRTKRIQVVAFGSLLNLRSNGVLYLSLSSLRTLVVSMLMLMAEAV